MRRNSGIFGRVLMGAAALLGANAPQAARASESWRASADDALLLDVRLNQYRLGDGVRGYETPDGVCVDLADTLIALDIPLRVDKKLRRATGWAFAESRTITIDREAGTEQIANKTTQLSKSDIHDTPEGWCVATKTLSRWFGIALDADQANALLWVKSSSKLPVELAMERQARAQRVQNKITFDLASLPQSSAPYKGVRMPSIDAVISLGGLRDQAKGSAQRGGRLNTQYELFAAGEVGPIAYNARLSSNRSGTPESLRVQAYRTDPKGQLLGPLHATTVAVGDVSGATTALVAQSGAGRGAMITNRPVERRDAFDKTDFRGELPSGWDAELYRNGQLLAFATNRADGRYEFLDVPLLYGQNRFEVVLYGPQGQVRREEKTVPVGLDSIPPRKTFYWAGIDQEGRDLIGLARPGQLGREGWRGTVGLERGFDAKTSFAAWAHSLKLDDLTGRSNFGEVAVRRAVGPTLMEVSGSYSDRGGGAVRAQVLGQLNDTYFSVESINAMGGFRSDRVLSGVTGIHSLSIDQTFKPGRSYLPVHFDARYTTRSTGFDTLDAAARVSASLGRISLTTELDWRREMRRSGPKPADDVMAGLLANARIGRIRLRGEARYRISPTARLESATLIGEWSAGGDNRDRSNDWRAEIGYDGAFKRGRAGIGYVRRFQKVALTASLEAATDGSMAAGLNLAFSIGPDPRRGGGMRLTSARLASQGQVVANVWRDLNGDGQRQDDEPLEKDVQLSAGRVPVENLTDPGGTVLIDGLEPFQPVLIGIDSSALPDPLVQPATPGIVVTPRPGVAVTINLPLVSAGEIDGTLVKAGGTAVEGVDLELIDVENRVVAKTRTEFDGFFLFEGVPYGRYSVRVAALSADAARIGRSLAGVALVDGKTPAVHLGAVAATPSDALRAGP